MAQREWDSWFTEGGDNYRQRREHTRRDLVGERYRYGAVKKTLPILSGETSKDAINAARRQIREENGMTGIGLSGD